MHWQRQVQVQTWRRRCANGTAASGRGRTGQGPEGGDARTVVRAGVRCVETSVTRWLPAACRGNSDDGDVRFFCGTERIKIQRNETAFELSGRNSIRKGAGGMQTPSAKIEKLCLPAHYVYTLSSPRVVELFALQVVCTKARVLRLLA